MTLKTNAEYRKLITTRLFCLCKSYAVVLHIKFCIKATNKNVAKNPNGSHGWGNIQAHESGQADGLSKLLNLHDIVLTTQAVFFTANGEFDQRQIRNIFTVNHVFSPHYWC